VLHIEVLIHLESKGAVQLEIGLVRYIQHQLKSRRHLI